MTPQPPTDTPTRRRRTKKTDVEPEAELAPGEQGAAFDAQAYDDPALSLEYADGRKIDKIAVQFSGTVELDRTNREHVALYRKLRLGREVDFSEMPPLAGKVQRKPARAISDPNGYVGDIGQTAVITITDIGGFGAEAAANTKPSTDPNPDAQHEGETSGDAEPDDA